MLYDCYDTEETIHQNLNEVNECNYSNDTTFINEKTYKWQEKVLT